MDTAGVGVFLDAVHHQFKTKKGKMQKLPICVHSLKRPLGRNIDLNKIAKCLIVFAIQNMLHIHVVKYS